MKDRWVLVTGASSGLGREIARDVARRHRGNLILVARRADRLSELADELREQHGVQALPVQADLSRPGDVERVLKESQAAGPVYGAVLNAGITHFGAHQELAWERFESLLATNVTATVKLVHHLVPHMLEHDLGGGIMLVTSMTGLVPTPYQTAYSASKAFLTAFGEGLYHELEGQNVSLTTFAPGGIDTEMSEKTGLGEIFASSGQIMAAPRCAQLGVDAMVARRYLAVPGLLNQFQVFLPRFGPRKLASGVLAGVYRKALKKT